MDKSQAQTRHQVGAQEATVELHLRKDIELGLGHQPVATAERSDEGANTRDCIAIEVGELFSFFCRRQGPESLWLQTRHLKGCRIIDKRYGAAGVHHHLLRGVVHKHFEVVTVSLFGLVYSENAVVVCIPIRVDSRSTSFVGLAAG